MEQKTADSQPVKNPGRTRWVVGIVAAVVAVLIFAAGTFVAGRLTAPGRGGAGGLGGQRPNFQTQAAKELPTDTPALSGVVSQRTGNSLSVGQRNGGGNGSPTPVEVVIDANTTLYHDTTQVNFNAQQPPSGAVQQTVEPGTVDAINTNSRVTVWGAQTGAQLTAKVLVYTEPYDRMTR